MRDCRLRHSGRAKLLVGVAAIAIGGFAGAASAQDTSSGQTDQAKAKDATTVNEVVVTGYRHSIEQSLKVKRNADTVVDVITAEDIGKFPDKNVADSLQRVPGVIITRDGGEGATVSVRGLSSDLTLTELNGNFIASSNAQDPSRSFDYVMLPSNMIASVEVYKSSEAKLDEGGVGGTIELHTRRPLDMPAMSGFLSVEGTDADTTNKFEPQMSGLVSWKNKAETFGLLLGATYQKRTDREMDGSTESWRWWADDTTATPATDIHHKPYANNDAISYWWGSGATTQSGTHYNGYWVPQSVDEAVLDEERKRVGLQATAQWKPTDNLTITANAFRFELTQNYVQSMLKIPEWGYGDFFTSAKLDPSHTIMEAATFQVSPTQACSLQTPPCTMQTPQLDGTMSREHDVSNTYDVNFDYHTDMFRLSVTAGNTRSTGGPSMLFKVAAKPQYDTATTGLNGNMLSSWDFTGGVPVMKFSPNILQNMLAGVVQVDTGSTGSSFVNSSMEQTYFQADATQRLGGLFGFLDSLQFGAKYRTGGVHRMTGNTFWYADKANQVPFQDTPAGSVAPPNFLLNQPIGNLGGGAFGANIFPAVNMPAYLSDLTKAYGQPVRRNETNFIYDVNETVWDGYLQANFKTSRLHGNVGVRIVNTVERSDSTDLITYLNKYYVPGTQTGYNGSNCTLAPDGGCEVLPIDQQQTQVNQLDSTTKNTTDILPSFNVAYTLWDNFVVRAAVAKVIARPGYDDLGSQQQLTYRSAAWAADRQQFGEHQGWSGGGGNKELRPYSAWQYDLDFEWYFHPGSVVGVGLFRKDVSDFIVPLVIDYPLTINNATVKVTPFQTSANGSNAVSQGVELYAQHTFPIGIGFQTNFTYNDTNFANVNLDGKKIGTSPLVGSAQTQANASVFYENKLFALRASWNRRGEMVGGIVSGLNVYTDPYQQVDLNGSVNIRKNLVWTASAINVTGSYERQHLGDDTTARYFSSVYAGRRFYTGLSYKF